MRTSGWMGLALAEARAAAARGEVPVGAVILDDAGRVLACAGNRVEERADATAHAEMLVIPAASGRLGTRRLDGCTLFVTLEPCTMCAAAISLAHISLLCFGAYDPKGGGVEHGARVFGQPTCHHRPEVIGGIEEQACALLLRDFFARRR